MVKKVKLKNLPIALDMNFILIQNNMYSHPSALVFVSPVGIFQDIYME